MPLPTDETTPPVTNRYFVIHASSADLTIRWSTVHRALRVRASRRDVETESSQTATASRIGTPTLALPALIVSGSHGIWQPFVANQTKHARDRRDRLSSHRHTSHDGFGIGFKFPAKPADHVIA